MCKNLQTIEFYLTNRLGIETKVIVIKHHLVFTLKKKGNSKVNVTRTLGPEQEPP